MARSEQRANRAEKMALELAEAVVLAGRTGQVFEAVVLDEGNGRDGGWVEIQIADPAVIARVDARKVDPGDSIRVKLISVDVERRHTEFERVS
jgi:exoribonuclease R